jgi:hypothetical protein
VHPAKVVDHQKVAVVDKEHVLLVFESAEHKVASSTRPFAFTAKRHHAVFMLVHGIEVSGVVHTSGTMDVLELHRLLAALWRAFHTHYRRYGGPSDFRFQEGSGRTGQCPSYPLHCKASAAV